MKRLYRKIDENGYFVEDVFFYIDTDGELPDNYIEAKIAEPFVKPKWNGSEWVEGGGLDALKEIKKQEIEQKAIEYQNRTIVIDGKEFHGGIDWARTYRDERQLADELGVTSGKVEGANGELIEVDRETITQVILHAGLNVKKGQLKRKYYLDAIDNAQTEEELNSIVWEDVRNSN